MNIWEQIVKGKVFITDLGGNQTTTIDEQEIVMGRYAAWSPVINGTGHQAVEVNDDLDFLMKKYEVPLELVCILNAKINEELP